MNKPKPIVKGTKVHGEKKDINEPEYMVQLPDPKMLRKDVLESLREVIIFMQGYEKFRKIQEEKVATFNVLKNDLKELDVLLEGKLRKYLPKGKLKILSPEEEKKQEVEVEEEHVEEVPVEEKPEPKEYVRPAEGELDALEAQLKEIEKQLKGMG